MACYIIQISDTQLDYLIDALLEAKEAHAFRLETLYCDPEEPRPGIQLDEIQMLAYSLLELQKGSLAHMKIAPMIESSFDPTKARPTALEQADDDARMRDAALRGEQSTFIDERGYAYAPPSKEFSKLKLHPNLEAKLRERRETIAKKMEQHKILLEN